MSHARLSARNIYTSIPVPHTVKLRPSHTITRNDYELCKHLCLVWSFGVSVYDMAHVQEQDKSFIASSGSICMTLSWVMAIPSLDDLAYKADRNEEIARNDERGTV